MIVQTEPQSLDISELLGRLCQKDRPVFLYQLGSDVFACTVLGRKDYRTIAARRINVLKKEELVCKAAVLYPENYDFEQAPAGIATKLCKYILKQSFLDEDTSLSKVVNYFRTSFNEDENKKISTLIHHAFPEYSLEEIESWDILKTAEHMVRSEFLEQIETEKEVIRNTEPESDPETESQKQTLQAFFSAKKTNKKNQLTPEKLRELQQKYPEIDWAHDSAAMYGAKAFQVEDVDDRAVAERPMDGSEDGQNALPKALRNRFKVITSET